MDLSDFHFPECRQRAVSCDCVEALTARLRAATLALEGVQHLTREIERLKAEVVRFGGEAPAPEIEPAPEAKCGNCGHDFQHHHSPTHACTECFRFREAGVATVSCPGWRLFDSCGTLSGCGTPCVLRSHVGLHRDALGLQWFGSGGATG